MTDTIKLSKTSARAMMLAATGLLQRDEGPRTREDVLATIRSMGVLQIDTIHVVARSPYLVLWSRLGDYDSRWLDELLERGEIFEYWAHEACFLPVEDYPLHRHSMIDPGSRGWRNSHAWLTKNARDAARMLDLVRKKGPVRASDFQRTDGRAGGWWDWKPEKQMLEKLYTAGELMIARRHNFHRIYDLRERVLPDWDDARLPPLADAHRTLAEKSVRAIGVATEPWAADYYRMKRGRIRPILRDLVAEGRLFEASIDGVKETAYIHRDDLGLAESAIAGELSPSLTTLLSPFDPLVWDRRRARQLFDFEYRIECYTPGPKRIYGYFTLPILWRGQLVGRLDPKAHRGEGRFEIKALHLEPDIRVNSEFASDLADALRGCAEWHNTPQIDLSWTNSPKLERMLRKKL
jgi:uncharacterized protein YcaQ